MPDKTKFDVIIIGAGPAGTQQEFIVLGKKRYFDSFRFFQEGN